MCQMSIIYRTCAIKCLSQNAPKMRHDANPEACALQPNHVAPRRAGPRAAFSEN